MSTDLDSLKTEIKNYLESEGFTVFHGYTRFAEPTSVVQWDSGHYPDFKLFLALARKLEVRPVVFHHRELLPELIDDAMDQLESADIPEDEFEELVRRLGELRVYEGFTNAVELSFEYQGRIYIYARRADWYDELLDIAEEIDDYSAPEEDEPDEDDQEDMSSYFSRN